MFPFKLIERTQHFSIVIMLARQLSLRPISRTPTDNLGHCIGLWRAKLVRDTDTSQESALTRQTLLSEIVYEENKCPAIKDRCALQPTCNDLPRQLMSECAGNRASRRFSKQRVGEGENPTRGIVQKYPSLRSASWRRGLLRGALQEALRAIELRWMRLFLVFTSLLAMSSPAIGGLKVGEMRLNHHTKAALITIWCLRQCFMFR
ncbi:hypothetical protein EAG_05587 [Camponotus floridanus]|uniref:Uncharacterized protein n=1 Tax=Camponotus floridanus TaxID=104421 RepID=E2A5E8_CAMFO|nr:hypothetical protein EAG_05587 [Camponotus floridanus]